MFLRKALDPHPAPAPTLFPTFLLPSIPFRRRSRQSSSDSNNSSLSSSSSDEATSPSASIPPFPDLDPAPVNPPTDKFLSGHASHLRCSRCSTDLCFTSQIICKRFTGRHGRAYLVQGAPTGSSAHCHATALPNTYQNRAVSRELATGQHTVSDISCCICGSIVGWKYVDAENEDQRYKVGKFILETQRIRSTVDWENGFGESNGDGDSGGAAGSEKADMTSSAPPPCEIHNASSGDQPIEFDSQDEDECEDLFAGVWSPDLALKRRRGRRFSRHGRWDGRR